MPCGSVGRRVVEMAESASERQGCATTAGQQRLHTAEERLAPAASAARAEEAEEGQASPARVGVAQESRAEEMTKACVTKNAENVKPELRYLGKIRPK